MSEELLAAFNVLVDYMNTGMKPKELADKVLEAYPPQEGETDAAALERLAAEASELWEGLIGAVILPDEI